MKIAVLVSGGGTNLQSIIDNVENGNIRAEIACVLSNRKDAYALERARKHRIPDLFLGSKEHRSREDYCKALSEELKKRGADLVCLAGFMCILTPDFTEKFPNRIMNIHPALLPSFGGEGMYGHHVHEAVLASGAKFSGCTVHFVDRGCDTGPIILQAVVPVFDEDTPESLAERVLREEHRIYPEAIKLFTEKKLSIIGRRVKIHED